MSARPTFLRWSVAVLLLAAAASLLLQGSRPLARQAVAGPMPEQPDAKPADALQRQGELIRAQEDAIKQLREELATLKAKVALLEKTAPMRPYVIKWVHLYEDELFGADHPIQLGERIKFYKTAPEMIFLCRCLCVRYHEYKMGYIDTYHWPTLPLAFAGVEPLLIIPQGDTDNLGDPNLPGKKGQYRFSFLLIGTKPTDPKWNEGRKWPQPP